MAVNLHKKVCGICGNIFYGKPKELMCVLCKVILELVGAFGLTDNFGKNYREIVEEVWRRVQEPQWDKEGETYDWGNYIPKKIQEKWFNFNDETRAMAVLFAERMAEMEDFK